MDHPFVVGEMYRNRDGRYEVVSIDAPKMRIRYEDGREAVLTIAVQQRIWSAMQLEAQQRQEEEGQAPKRKTSGSRPARQGYEFSGLQESDFKNDVTGTHWRSRANLGGRLAQHLGETTPYQFESHAIYRRPSVYLVVPGHYDRDDGIPYAKQELRLFPEGAQYGFYVERADRSRAIDSTWHWRPFLRALADADLQEQLAQAMRDHDLAWLLQIEEGTGKDYATVQRITVQAGEPLLWAGTERVDWAEFISRLNAVPVEQWLNVHLCTWTDKDEALDTGAGFAEQVTRAMRAALPLYTATIGV